jgi:hypothetical protein
MPKRNKNSKSAVSEQAHLPTIPPAEHFPRKHPALLLTSVLLFAAWFFFLLVTAFSG